MTNHLPAAYRAFIDANGLFEGLVVISEEEHYVILWGEDEVTTANVDMEVGAYAPGFVAFAGNGGGEIYAFDERGAVFMLPMIGMALDVAIKVADNFPALARGFQRGTAVGN